MERQVPDVFDVFALGQGGDTFLPSSIIWRTIIKTAQKAYLDNSKHCAQRWRGEARDWRLSCCSLGDQDVGAGGGDLPTDYHDNHFSDYDGCHDYED